MEKRGAQVTWFRKLTHYEEEILKKDDQVVHEVAMRMFQIKILADQRAVPPTVSAEQL